MENKLAEVVDKTVIMEQNAEEKCVHPAISPHVETVALLSKAK